MAPCQVAFRYPFYEYHPCHAEMAFQIVFGLLLRVSRIAFRVSERAPVQDHRVDAVELEISPLVDNVNPVDRNVQEVAHMIRYAIVPGIGDVVPESAAPGIEFPVLDAQPAIPFDIDRPVVTHPGTVIGYLMPHDPGMFRITPGKPYGCHGSVSRFLCVVDDMELLITGNDFGQPAENRLELLFKSVRPLQPHGFLVLPFGRHPDSTGGLGRTQCIGARHGQQECRKGQGRRILQGRLTCAAQP